MCTNSPLVSQYFNFLNFVSGIYYIKSTRKSVLNKRNDLKT